MNTDLTQLENGLALVEHGPLDQNPAQVYLESLSASGKRSQENALRVIASIITGSTDYLAVPWHKMRYQHVQAVRTRLVAVYSVASVNRMLCALRRVLKEAWRLDQMESEEYYRAADVESAKGSTLPTGRALSSGELAALMAVCEADPSPAGTRDAAIIGCLYLAGLRRNELVQLDREHYDETQQRIVVYHAKRSKQRSAFLDNGAARAMADWLAIRGDDDGPLFYPVTKSGNLRRKRLTAQSIYVILAKRGQEAGVQSFTPHDVRRSFISDLLDAGIDIATVAQMAGQVNPATTARYDRRPEETRRKAVQHLHLPYRGKP